MSLKCSICGSTEKLHQLPSDEQYAEKWKNILGIFGIKTFPDTFRLCLLHFDPSHIFHFRNLFKWAVPKRELLEREFWEDKVNLSPKRARDDHHLSLEHPPKRKSIQPRQFDETEIALPPANKNDPAKDPLALPQLVKAALEKASTLPPTPRRSVPIIHVGRPKKTLNTKKSPVITTSLEKASTAPTPTRRSLPNVHVGGAKKTPNNKKSTVITARAEISPTQAKTRHRGIPIIHATGGKTPNIKNPAVITTPIETSPIQFPALQAVKITPVAQVPASAQKSATVPDYFVTQDKAKLISVSDVKYCTEQIAKQAINTLKEDIDRHNQKNDIIQKKLDILKLKVRTYEKFIYKLVSKNIISIESAKEYSVMQSDIDRSKAKRNAQSAAIDGKDNSADKSADHDYV